MYKRQNLDGSVDVLGDAFALVGNLGTTTGAVWADGDFNGDGAVNVLDDAFILVGRLGQSVLPPAAGSFSLGSFAESDLDGVFSRVVIPAVLSDVELEKSIGFSPSLPNTPLIKEDSAAKLSLAGSQSLDRVFEETFL